MSKSNVPRSQGHKTSENDKKSTPKSRQNGTAMTPAEVRQVDPQTDMTALKHALLVVLEQHREAWTELPEDKALRLDREGLPVAVVMSYQGFEALLDRLEDLEDAQRADEALEALKNGEETAIPWEEAKAALRAEGLLGE
jgi:hypothetical protein